MQRGFRRILVPIPSERFPEQAVSRAMELARVFDAELLMLYIIQENVMGRMDHATQIHLTHEQRHEIEEQLVRRHEEEADKIHFIRVRKLADDRDVDFRKYIRKGKFGPEVRRMITEENADLVVMELRDDTLLKFRLVEHCTVPLWLEKFGGKSIRNIFAVCTNRAPNEFVPRLGHRLARGLGASLTLEYIVDCGSGEDALVAEGREFLERLSAEYSPDVTVRTQCRTGPLVPTAREDALKAGSDLIIVGRAAVKKGFMGRTSRDDKVTLAREAQSSVLMIN